MTDHDDNNDHDNEDANEELEAAADRLAANMDSYYHGILSTMLLAMGRNELNHSSAIKALLAVASGIASDLDEDGIALFESISADMAIHMRTSKGKFDSFLKH